MAVSACDAAESVAMLNVAVPPVSVPVPSVVVPSLKATVPVAVDGDTTAVSVTFCPKLEGFAVVRGGEGMTSRGKSDDAEPRGPFDQRARAECGCPVFKGHGAACREGRHGSCQ